MLPTMQNDIQATLSQMRKAFIERLPERLAVIRSLLGTLTPGQSAALEDLHRAAHSLVGAAGVHRLLLVSDAARRLEQLAQLMLTEGGVTDHGLDELHDACNHLALQIADPSHNFVPAVSIRRKETSRVIVVDDDRDQATWLCSVLKQAGYQAEAYSDLSLFAELNLLANPPVAVIMDMIFPEGDHAGADAMVKLKEQSLNGFPVIFTSVRQDLAAKLLAYRAGATCYLTKPIDTERLMQVIGDSVALMPAESFRVLLVDDDSEQRVTHGLMLRQSGMTVLELNNPLRVLEVLEEFSAEVLVLDMYMPECTGPELAVILRDDQKFQDIPIVYLSSEINISQQLLALNRGGDHFLTKPVDPRHLVATVSMHARRFRQTKEQADNLRFSRYEKERQQQALDAHAIVSASDAAGRIIYVNDRFCEVSGYDREELLGNNHRIVKSDQHSAEFYLEIWRTISKGGIWRGEVCNRRKDGSLYWVETTIVPFLDQAGSPYQYVSVRTEVTHIKENELRLRVMERAIDASSSCICIADAGQFDNPLIYVNPAFEKVTGYSRAEVMGKNARFLQGCESKQPGLDEIRAVLREARTGRALLHNYRKDGSSFWNELGIAPVFDDSNRVTHFIGICDDVTERLNSSEALQRSEERFRRSQLYANIATWDWNIQTGELICSERINNLFGLSDVKLPVPHEIYLHNVHPDDKPRLLDAINQCVYHGAEFNIEIRCVWPDGMVRWLQERGDVVRADDGRPLNMLGVVQDITKRKQAELKTLEQQQHLLFYKHVIDNVVDGVVAMNAVGEILSFNPAAEKLFGYPSDEVIGQSVELLLTGSVMASDESSHAHTHGQILNAKKTTECSGVCRDGARFPLELSVSTMDDDQYGHYVAILRDISQRKRYEREILDAKDQAEQANNAKSEFLSSMSHELRTPMNAILGFGQLLEIEANLTADQTDYVGEILKAGHHLLELINEVLDLAKIESGKMHLSLEPLVCKELVSECVALVASIAQAQGIEIHDQTVGNYIVFADRTRLKQVLLNLLSNAIKYNRPQGQVWIRMEQQAGTIRLFVIDNGYGIEEARQVELFQPFSRLGAENLGIEGTGIGLTISRRLMKMMGGQIGMSSQEGQGCSFWFELPEVLVDEMSTALIEQEQENQETFAVNETQERTILYIEDNPANLRLVAQILGRQPHLRLLTAHNPGLGLELATARCPDLILLDINLPGMDGYQVLSILRTIEAVKKTPVIAISANAMPKDIELGFAAGFDAYITKPIDVTLFLDEVSRFLANR